MTDWRVFSGNCKQPRTIVEFPSPPPWRQFLGEPVERVLKPASERGARICISPNEVEAVNAAIHLRRPLLVTGKPGTGKSSLAYAIAYELNLGQVLVWPITTRTTLQDGLYHYDAIGRLNQVAVEERHQRQDRHHVRTQSGPENEIPETEIGDYLILGPLGTALLPSKRPRVLLLDEIDKSDVDFPNDLLHVFEEGCFEIRELMRIAKKHPTVRVGAKDGGDPVTITGGQVACHEFPIVVMTSNGERDFPPAFKRRCLRIHMPEPSPDKLKEIVAAHLGEQTVKLSEELIATFLSRREKTDLSTDQLLNAIRLATSGPLVNDKSLLDMLLKPLSGPTSI